MTRRRKFFVPLMTD